MSHVRRIPLATSVTAWACACAAACAPLPDEDAADPAADPNESTSEYALAQVTGFGSNPGNLQMYTHVPPGLPASAPIILVLHGCTQSAAAMEASGWTTAANAYGFYLVYAQQPSANNSNSCFNWFELGDITRGQGEALSLRQMVGWALANASTDPNRVFVMGLSAGAYMASTMAATYPDVFAGAAIVAGGPHHCAEGVGPAFTCMNPGVNKTPAAWGDLVRSAFPGYTGRLPKISLWHGASDTTVRPGNLTEAMEQWTNVHNTDQTPDLTETVSGATHKVYRDAAGTAVVESYEIPGMPHAVPVDPQVGFPGGGACGTTGQYFSDVNLCSVQRQAQFFGLLTGTPTGTPPTVQLTSPAAGATVSGDVALTATASDDTGVARVDFLVDGAQVGSDSSAPYEVAWSSASVANGSHTVTARAVDTAGNTATSARTITTSNGAPSGTTVSFASIAAEDGYVKANADGSAAVVGTITTPAVGRGTDGKQNRALFSFDTSSLPDGAVVTAATVTVTYSSGVGSPWGDPAGNSLVADVRRGTFGLAATELTDWAATADAPAAAQLAAFASGTRTSSGFSAAGLSAIHPAGRTQVRLRFVQPQAATAYVFLGQGAAATLTVVYR